YEVPTNSEIARAVRRAAALCGACGFTIEAFAPTGLERAPNVWSMLFHQWSAQMTRKMVEGRESETHWTLLESRSLAGPPPTSEQVLMNLAARDRMRASLIRQMEHTPVLLMPVSSITAFRHRERRWACGGKEIGLFQAMMPAVIANVLGLPAVSIPIEL